MVFSSEVRFAMYTFVITFVLLCIGFYWQVHTHSQSTDWIINNGVVELTFWNFETFMETHSPVALLFVSDNAITVDDIDMYSLAGIYEFERAAYGIFTLTKSQNTTHYTQTHKLTSTSTGSPQKKKKKRKKKNATTSQLASKLNIGVGAPPAHVKRYMNTAVWTSESHPIYVEWLKKKYKLRNNGNGNGNTKTGVIEIDFDLGMTLCPGKYQPDSMSGCTWDRNVETDVKVLKALGANCIVTLLSKSDFARLRVENLLSCIEENGMKSFWYDIIDGSAPSDEEQWKEMVIDVTNRLTVKREKVVVHCMGGLRRTGTFVVSVLKYLQLIDNSMLNEANRWLHQSRKNAGPNSVQQKFIEQMEFEYINTVSDDNGTANANANASATLASASNPQ